MENYLDIINIMDYPTDYKVRLAYAWIHPENLPKELVELGNFESKFYKMPDFFTNHFYISGCKLERPITVPVIGFRDSLFEDNVEIEDLILSTYQCVLPIEAFKGMKNLKRIWIPKRITYIPKDCFKDCDSLEEVYFEGTYEEFNKINIFYKRYKVIPKLGLYDDIEEYYEYGNLPFINAKKHFNQTRDVEKVKEYFITLGKKDITNVISKKMKVY